MVDMYHTPSPPCLYNLCKSVHSCSISQFFIRDVVGPVSHENVLKAFCLEHIVFIGL